jgi:hypothetical protein
MKYIITENQYSKFVKPEPVVIRTVYKYLNSIFKNSKRTVIPKSRNYGNIGEEYCINGKVVMITQFYYNTDEDSDFVGTHESGSLFIDTSIMNEIISTFKLRKTVVLNIIIDWYFDTYLDKVRSEFGDSNLEIDEIYDDKLNNNCLQDVDTSNVSREEMLDFIYKKTLYSKPEKDNISDTELTDLYVQIKHITQRKKDWQ